MKKNIGLDGLEQHPGRQTASPSTPVDEVKDKHTEPDVIPEVLAEVREYTNLPIMLTDFEFAPNHLFCVRGKYCEFTELSKVVQVYVYPTYQKDKHTESKQPENNFEQENPDILDLFIREIKDEFKDENWDYLYFIAERVRSKNL